MDVAIEAEVSTKSVSMALRGHPGVALETANRIREVAGRLGYVPRRGVGNVLGVAAPYVGHAPYGELLGFIRGHAGAYDYLTLIAETAGDPAMERDLIGEFGRRGVAGMILVGPRLTGPEIEMISRTRQPVVVINAPIGDESTLQFGSVEIDNEAGAYAAVRYLYENGHRKIAYLAGRRPATSEQRRRRGYLRALEDSGVPIDEGLVVEIQRQVVASWPNSQAGYEQCKWLLNKGTDVDAIVAYNDAMAMGALRALHEKELRVPHDVSVVGFDNSALGRFTVPRLTSVGIQWERLAGVAVDLLLQLIGGGESESELQLHQVLTPEIIVRDSVDSRVIDEPSEAS